MIENKKNVEVDNSFAVYIVPRSRLGQSNGYVKFEFNLL